ncbi:permease of the drug/metabolite transporter DMT superfamily [Candidatus Scalindua japonica]|uniref:Permease of the drug/metabolite transporter DMT superfamily n=1 Tax=Candidatus Scalindua japonica TaxID=1284222 RepID=A0A286TZI0_9BACT|nr:EamA family transporter [Candidatus Scalindua japonica]GAX61276.1 permease of the drug/metabolite transporter DMT superfamily [Candidatus Scalindua japonica]
MDLWFIYAISSAVFSGLHTFIQKIAVERGHSTLLVNMWSTVVSSVLAFTVSWIFFSFDGLWKIGLFLGFINGLTHIIGSIFRMDALKYIDTAIMFPLYKTAGPIFTLVIGIIIFAEKFTVAEWVGITLGITVPLLLLHKSEKLRQKYLWKGVVFLLIASFFTAVAAGISKYGTGIFETVFLFVAVSHTFGSISGWGIYELQKSNTHRNGKLFKYRHIDKDMLSISFLAGITQFAGFSAMMLAFVGGSLGIVYAIQSLYILIPIILSIIIYKEHWNMRKIIAIILSIVALAFLR